jgi:hypothetical protein
LRKINRHLLSNKEKNNYCKHHQSEHGIGSNWKEILELEKNENCRFQFAINPTGNVTIYTSYERLVAMTRSILGGNNNNNNKSQTVCTHAQAIVNNYPILLFGERQERCERRRVTHSAGRAKHEQLFTCTRHCNVDASPIAQQFANVLHIVRVDLLLWVCLVELTHGRAFDDIKYQ